MIYLPKYLLAFSLGIVAISGTALCQVPALPTVSQEERIVQDATIVFEQMLTTPGVAIPKAMLSGAEGVAIIPRVVKGGFIIGARHGRGVVITRDASGVWHAPVFLTITGGNVGWQAGVQSTDVVLVYRTQRSIESLMAGKLTIGADIAAAAGPVGREASVATDTRLAAEVYSYSRSRGLFAGVSLDGSVLKVDHAATAAYYRPATDSYLAGGPNYVTPPSAQRLVSLVVEQTSTNDLVPVPEPSGNSPQVTPSFDQRHTFDEAASIRDQLAEFAPRLYRILEPNWQSYLSLPVEVFQETGHPSPEQFALSAQRFDEVASNPNYAGLAARPEFQTVHGLVRHYQQLMQNAPQPLNLPPPPMQ